MEKFCHWIHHETYNISAKQNIRVVTAWWGRCGSCWVIITHYVKLFGGFATFHVVWSRPHPVDVSVLQAARMGRVRHWDSQLLSHPLLLGRTAVPTLNDWKGRNAAITLTHRNVVGLTGQHHPTRYRDSNSIDLSCHVNEVSEWRRGRSKSRRRAGPAVSHSQMVGLIGEGEEEQWPGIRAPLGGADCTPIHEGQGRFSEKHQYPS